MRRLLLIILGLMLVIVSGCNKVTAEEKTALEYVKSKGYRITSRKGEMKKYTLEKNKLYGRAETLPYQQMWSVQKEEPDKYFGKELDIAHAKITAANCQENVYDYLSRLPLERVEEIHIAGTSEKVDVELRDSHLEMKQEDYEILQWVLSKTSPRIITLEYGGLGEAYSWRSNKGALKRQIFRLYDICR